MDILNELSKKEFLVIGNAINDKKPPENIEPVGFCYNCLDKVANDLFCSAGCRDLYQCVINT